MLGVLTPGIADGAGRSLRRRRDVAGPVAPLTYSAARPPRPSPPSCCPALIPRRARCVFPRLLSGPGRGR